MLDKFKFITTIKLNHISKISSAEYSSLVSVMSWSGANSLYEELMKSFCECCFGL